MDRSLWGAAAALLAGACLAAPAIASADPAATATVTGTAIPAGATATGTVDGSQQLTFNVWLTPADAAGATAFADAASTPGSAAYHQYLTPDQYTARFGPTATEASDVASWLSSAGFTAVQASSQRDYVSATGSVARINQAFAVTMTDYQVTGPAGKPIAIQANNTDVSVPASIAPDVLSVTGLNSTPATPGETSTTDSGPFASTCSHYWAQKSTAIKPAFRGVTQAPNLVCGYSADQLRSVYGMTNAATGTGQTVALIELGGPTAMFQTLTDYAKTNNLPAPKSTQYREEIIGQGDACGPTTFDDGEEQLDSEAVYAMAPGADQLMVDGDSCNAKRDGIQPLYDADAAVLGGDGSGPQATIVSNSWESGDESSPPGFSRPGHVLDLRAAAEGVGMYFDSGDNPGVRQPASDPYSTAVGGTSLGIGAQNQRLFETGWSDAVVQKQNGQWKPAPFDPLDAAGGGTSLLWSQPSYQAGVVPASMSTVPGNGSVDRAVPDIAADADYYTGMSVGIIEPNAQGQPGPYTTSDDGGTSLATPLIAGMVADAQQGQSASFGFINPLLYSLAGSSAYNDVLPPSASTPAQDTLVYRPSFSPPGSGVTVPAQLFPFDTQNRNQTGQVTAPGYDTMSGLGTPNGQAFITRLRSGK